MVAGILVNGGGLVEGPGHDRLRRAQVHRRLRTRRPSPACIYVPLGTTVRELIERAGGMKDGRKLLAFAPGGASSNFLPPTRRMCRSTSRHLQKAGSMLGSGALVVVAEGTDLLALATNVVRFFRNESCGKCVPCRVGSEKAVEMLEGVQAGTMPKSALDVLPELGETMALTSICGLGQVAVAPALSVLKHGRNWPMKLPSIGMPTVTLSHRRPTGHRRRPARPSGTRRSRLGIDIPVLCHHRSCDPVGVCRMCVVDVGRPRARRVLRPAVRGGDEGRDGTRRRSRSSGRC